KPPSRWGVPDPRLTWRGGPLNLGGRSLLARNRPMLARAGHCQSISPAGGRSAIPPYEEAVSMTVESSLFEAWLSVTDDGAIAVDPGGGVVLHNPAASRVTGMPPEGALHRPWREVLNIDDHLAGQLWSARRGSSPVYVVGDVVCAQGNRRTAEIVSAPWRAGSGSAEAGVLILIRDLAALCRQCRAPLNHSGYGNLIGEHPRMQELYQL